MAAKQRTKIPTRTNCTGGSCFHPSGWPLIPFLGKYIIVGISAVVIFSVKANYLIIAAIVTCLLLFVFPLFLLGTVTPSLAKYTMDSLSDNGKIVGTLGAMNTIGSILGTFLPTFVTIPAIGTNLTFLIFSGILLVLSAVYFLSNGKRLRKVGAAAILFVAACLLGYKTDFAFWESREELLYEGESVYNYLRVQTARSGPSFPPMCCSGSNRCWKKAMA
jgi:predicted membrane-bound spermidine synthase